LLSSNPFSFNFTVTLVFSESILSILQSFLSPMLTQDPELSLTGLLRIIPSLYSHLNNYHIRNENIKYYNIIL